MRAIARYVYTALRNNFGAGLLVFVPVALTVWLVTLAADLIDRPIRQFLREPPADAAGVRTEIARLLQRVTGGTISLLDQPGVGLLMLIAGIFLLGMCTRTFLGRWIVALGEVIVRRVPLVRSVYTGTKQILEAILAGSEKHFRDVVLFEYPRNGIYAIGFVTSTSRGEIQDRTSRDAVNVFLPTTPNPTSGYLLVVPRSELTYLDMSVEDAVKLIISGGIVSPRVSVRATNPPAGVQHDAHVPPAATLDKGGAQGLGEQPNAGAEREGQAR